MTFAMWERHYDVLTLGWNTYLRTWKVKQISNASIGPKYLKNTTKFLSHESYNNIANINVKLRIFKVVPNTFTKISLARLISIKF